MKGCSAIDSGASGEAASLRVADLLPRSHSRRAHRLYEDSFERIGILMVGLSAVPFPLVFRATPGTRGHRHHWAKLLLATHNTHVFGKRGRHLFAICASQIHGMNGCCAGAMFDVKTTCRRLAESEPKLGPLASAPLSTNRRCRLRGDPVIGRTARLHRQRAGLLPLEERIRPLLRSLRLISSRTSHSPTASRLTKRQHRTPPDHGVIHFPAALSSQPAPGEFVEQEIGNEKWYKSA